MFAVLEDGTRVYGPYLRSYPDGSRRRQVVFNRLDGSKSSMSYARWIYTCAHGPVPAGMDVDHIDENRLNDDILNLQLLTPVENVRKANAGKVSPLRGIERGWQHGTLYGWMKKHCECTECVVHKRAWHGRRNEARRKPGGYGPRRCDGG